MSASENDLSGVATRRRRAYNFCAGPAALPEEVLLEVREELPIYDELGASILEVSHRSEAYDAIEESARSRIKSLLGLSEEWHVLFLQGGASMQFHQVPLNFLPPGGRADYVLTGRWSVKAIKEAQLLGEAHVAASSEDKNYSYIPDPAIWNLSKDAAYVHITTNNTVHGSQFRKEPEIDRPLVADVSSDFLSRPINAGCYGLLYAGAQKNAGPAGVTIVLVREGFLQKRNSPLPTMLDYGTHAARRFNTPPVFAIYIVEKLMRWLEREGGVEAMQERNREKAGRLYERIDRNDFYQGMVEKASRSVMNVTFRLPSEELEDRFVGEAEQNNLLALRGHRSVGGIRASLYNACPPEAVEALVAFMDAFEQRYG